MLVAQQESKISVSVVLIARQTSSRLPNKVLLDFGGKKLIEVVLEKVLINTEDYIFAIPDNEDNFELKKFLNNKGYRYFAGSEHDVLGRFVQASQNLDGTYIQRLNCDNLLFDASYIAQCYQSLYGESDIYTNVNCVNHSGTSVEIIRKDRCVLSRQPTAYESEHVFPYFYANTELSTGKLECPTRDVFPIDTEADFEKALALQR